MKLLIILISILSSITCAAQYPEEKNPIKIERDWQLELLNKSNKNIRDYYLLLPDYLFSCELDYNNDKANRLKSITYSNNQNGYLKAKPESPLIVVIFKDRTWDRDIIAITRCGPTCQCFEVAFFSISLKLKSWISVPDVLPTITDFQKLQTKLENKFNRKIFPYFDLPENGTTIKVLDEGTKRKEFLYLLKWESGQFTIDENSN